MRTRQLDQPGERKPRALIARVDTPVDEPAERDDKVLTLAFKRGDKGAYQAIHDRYAHRVHGVCRRMLLHPEDAEEAAQESFLRVYQALGRFNGRYLLGPWITRITTNVCLDHLRARGRRPVDLMPVEVLDANADWDADLDPQEMHVKRVEGRRVRNLLESLPPLYRAAIVLRDFEGLSYSEVAAALEITEPQTKALIHRARQAFKRSWSSALLALPLRFLNRVKRFEGSAREQGNQAAASVQHTSEAVSSAVHAASQCSTIIQHCGQFLADRAAAVATVVVVTTAGAATMSAPAQTAPAEPSPTRVEVQATDASDLVSSVDRSATRAARVAVRTEKDPPAEPEPAPAPTPVEEPSALPEDPATEEPAPEPTEQPSEEPGDDGRAEVPPQESPSPSPSPSPLPPQGFTLGFVVDGPTPASACSCVAPTKVQKSDVGATSAGIERLDQVLTGSATVAGANTYGLWVDHQSPSGTSHSMDLRLFSNEGGYYYTGSGTLVDRVLMDWSGWRYTYRGTYKLTSRPGGAERATMSGTYTVVVAVSWQENRVVSTDFTLDDAGS